MPLKRFKSLEIGKPVVTALCRQMTLSTRYFRSRTPKTTSLNWNIWRVHVFNGNPLEFLALMRLASSSLVRRTPQTYAQAFLSLDAYHRTYVNGIFPSNADAADQPLQNPVEYISTDDKNDGERSGDRVIAPHVHLQPGRRRKRRIRAGVEGPFGTKRAKKCGRCDGLGHCRTTCPSAISGS